jgi:hypothetical protein
MLNVNIDSKLITDIIDSLNDICTSILQTNRNIAQDILIGKLSFIGTTAGVSSFIALIGTSSTGSAIATLTGIASTNATLAWLGGSVLLGSSILTGGAIAISVSSIYFWNGKKRFFDDLCQYEKEIINASMQIIEILQDEQSIISSSKAISRDFLVFIEKILFPLLLNIYKFSDEILVNLNSRFKLKFTFARIDFMKLIDPLI